VTYALASMLTGQMLLLASNPGPHYSIVLWSGNGAQPWNYPALLVSAGWGVLALPFFPTVAMLAVSAGVGLGMAVAVLLVVQLARERRTGQGRTATLGSISGLSPALLALLTLGACCSTTAAATAGIGVVAQASGTTVSQLLAANWYLGVFQIFVLWIALLAQEQLLTVSGALSRTDPPEGKGEPNDSVARGRLARAGLLRLVLLVGGVAAVVSVPAAWVRSPIGLASAATWFDWIFGHGVLGGCAIFAALFPAEFARAGARLRGRPASWRWLRGGLLVVGLGVVGYVPPPVAGWGFAGLGNQLLGVAGIPAAWGAVSPSLPPGIALGFDWAFQFLVVGAWALALALRPEATLSILAPARLEGGAPNVRLGWRTDGPGPLRTSVVRPGEPSAPIGRQES
jgi:hypothetical protein